MVSCGEFRKYFSEYRDGYLDPADAAAMREHVKVCEACARHQRAFELGIGELKALPSIEPSYDFVQRLQHRLYHLDEERSTWGRSNGSGASSGFVLGLVLLISAAAWVPLAKQRAAVVQLPPVVAATPKTDAAIPSLFQEGPLLLRGERTGALGNDPPITVYGSTRVGSFASYRPGISRLR